MKHLLSRNLLVSEYAIIFYLVISKILIHLIHPEYGYFRDELYYIAIADGFNFENLDMLPLTPIYLKIILSIFGYSIKSIHFASSLPGAFSLLLSCLIAKELGGKKYSIFLTGLFVMFSGFMIFGALFTYDSLDFLLSVFTIYLLIKIIKSKNQKLWLLIGLVLGLGLLNKISILFFGCAIFISLLLTPHREYFKTKWIWLGGVTALLFTIPFILWQSQNNWYFLDFALNYSGGNAYDASNLEFLWNQILPNNILAFPVWILGLALLIGSKKWKEYRLFGYMYLVLFFIFNFIGAKFYFLVPMYTILLAVGSIKIENYLETRISKFLKVTRYLLPPAFVVLSFPLLMMIIPLLPPEHLVKYVSYFGVNAGVRTESSEASVLPHHFADRFGWEEMVDQAANIYINSLTENNDTGILAQNYGQTSAIHLFGKKHSLPEPISLSGWFYFETLHNPDFKNNYVVIGHSRQDMMNIFEEVEEKGVISHDYSLPEENNIPIWLCKKPKYNLSAYWKIVRNIDSRFLEIMKSDGVNSALEYFRLTKLKSPSVPLFTERQLNSLGYEYLNNGKIREAIDLFKLNVEVYPASSNVYDSLGEAYMEDGQYELSIINYKKSLELNPLNQNAESKIKEIEKM